jgi:hypothetical protein
LRGREFKKSPAFNQSKVFEEEMNPMLSDEEIEMTEQIKHITSPKSYLINDNFDVPFRVAEEEDSKQLDFGMALTKHHSANAEFPTTGRKNKKTSNDNALPKNTYFMEMQEMN